MPLSRFITQLPVRGCEKNNPGQNCIDDLEKAFYATIKDLSFPYATYNLIQYNDEENPFPQQLNVSYTPIFGNYPELWMTYYMQHQFYNFDAVIRTMEYVPVNAQLSYGTWEDAKQCSINNPKGDTEREREEDIQGIEEVYKKAAEHGLKSGVYIIHKVGLAQFFITLASTQSSENILHQLKNSSLWNTLLSLTVLTNHTIISSRGCNKCNKNVLIYGTHEIIFTAAQKKILKLYAEKGNATIDEVATTYGASREAINFHLKSIRTKLKKPKVSGYALARFAIDHNLI